MNNDLNSLILSNAKDKVAKEQGYADWLQIDYSEMESCERDSLKLVLTEEAALIAMEELAGFLRWLSLKEYRYSQSKGDHWYTNQHDEYHAETDLYTQYLKEKKDESN